MLDQRRTAAESELSLEQIFTERYEILLAWALHLTHQQRDSAEDLVQDAFVQFMLARTQLEEIENINGYLRRLLRTYACFRKESSRAGSVLILRFFLDYYPTEIASVLSSSHHCVDQWQRLARREVKVFMDEPDRLRFVDTRSTAPRPWTRYPASDCDLMLALRAMIFDSRQGPCLTEAELKVAYGTGKTDALSTTELAHVVSCRSCLNAINTMLGLPLLADRESIADHIGRRTINLEVRRSSEADQPAQTAPPAASTPPREIRRDSCGSPRATNSAQTHRHLHCSILAINSDADLTRAVERLHRTALANNKAISLAFTLSTEISAAAFKSSQFRLEGAAPLAERIAQYSR